MQPDQHHQPTRQTQHHVAQPLHSSAPLQHAPHPHTADDGLVLGAFAIAFAAALPPIGVILGILTLKKTKQHTPAHTLGQVGVIVGVILTFLMIAYFILLVFAEVENANTTDATHTPSDYTGAQEL